MDELRNLNNRNFYKIINKTEEEFEAFLSQIGLLHGNQRKCNACGGKMNKRSRGVKGETFRCTTKNCRKEVGIRKDTFFEKSNLKFVDVRFSYLLIIKYAHIL